MAGWQEPKPLGHPPLPFWCVIRSWISGAAGTWTCMHMGCPHRLQLNSAPQWGPWSFLFQRKNGIRHWKSQCSALGCDLLPGWCGTCGVGLRCHHLPVSSHQVTLLPRSAVLGAWSFSLLSSVFSAGSPVILSSFYVWEGSVGSYDWGSNGCEVSRPLFSQPCFLISCLEPFNSLVQVNKWRSHESTDSDSVRPSWDLKLCVPASDLGCVSQPLFNC